MAKVAFSGSIKLIVVNTGITSLDVKADLYSDWKEWIRLSDNSKYSPAFSVIGGEPIGGGKFAGSIFFLLNDWKIRPYEANHELSIDGNIFTDDQTEITVPTVGTFRVTVRVLASNLAQGIETPVLSVSQATYLLELWKLMGLDITTPLTVGTSARTAGTISQQISENAGVVTVQRN